METMRPRISASKKILRQLQAKMNFAKQNGEISTLRRVQGLTGVVNQGMEYEEVATVIGVSAESVRLWVRDFLVTGIESLIPKRSPGRPTKLSKKDKKKLKQAIKDGPEASGYMSGCWNSPMIQDFIHKTFGVLYSVYYVAELMKNLGMSYQKAAFASAHIDPKKRKEWLKTRWPELLKKSLKLDSYLLFGDEASFPQWGSLSYTWAPKGQQPVVKTSGNRRGYKVFGLIDYWTGKFFYKAITGKFTSESYADFLRGVLRQTRKHLIIIQDGARYHTSEDMCAFFYENKDRITIAQMPSYSPDYNPIEILWKKIKGRGVHLKYFPTFESLMARVDELLAKFSASPDDVLKVFGFYTKGATY
jgi:transposase